MAPRVIHFCHNQIAWECKGFQDVEGHPHKDTTLRVRYGEITDEGRLKDLDAKHGIALRADRLKGFDDPDKNLPNLGMFELWKRTVEVYSRTRLTVSRDKLIALSGIAQEFSEKIKSRYVAGLWRKHLESQLLWQVNELYRDGIFENPGRRDPRRAPSFSWASIDTPHGVTYAETTNYDGDKVDQLLFNIEKKGSKIVLEDENNPFGLIKSAYLKLKPRYLRQIEIRRLEPPWRVPYAWRLIDPPPDFDSDTASESDDHLPSREQTVEEEDGGSTEHYNLYLDAPESDTDVFERDASLFCMPAAFGPRTVPKQSRSLFCLLLLQTKTSPVREFRRVGITELSSHIYKRSHEELMKIEFGDDIFLH